jgi:hypothetical protein
MNALGDTNVALRKCDLDAGFTEFFLNSKIEIAGTLHAGAFYRIGLTKN